jgi:signal transduction histidine kinase
MMQLRDGYRQGYYWVSVFCFAAIISSCQSPSDGAISRNPVFDPVFKRVDMLQTEDKDLAFAILDSAFNAYPDPDPADWYRNYNFKRRYFSDVKKDYDSAMIYADSQIRIIQDKVSRPAYMKDYGKALFYRGDVLMEQKKYDEAYLSYYQGREVIVKTRDTCVLNEYSARLGTACYRQKRYSDGIVYYKNAFRELSHCTGDQGLFEKFASQQGMLDNIALCYDRMELSDSAAWYYDSALHYIEKYENEFQHNSGDRRFIEIAKGVIYGNQGDAYYKKGDTARAEVLYKESIRINAQKGYANEDAQFTTGKLAGMYLSARRFKDAERELKNLRSTLDQLPGRDAELLWRKLQWQYNDSTGRMKDAYGYLLGYLQLKDSMDAGNKPADVNGELQHIARGYELGFLKKRIEAKTMYLAIAIIFAVMAALFAWQVWWNWRRSRRNVRTLTALNLQVRLQNDQLQTQHEQMQKQNEQVQTQNGLMQEQHIQMREQHEQMQAQNEEMQVQHEQMQVQHEQMQIQHEQMQKLLDELGQSQLANTRMMKIAAHDLRNPIGAISSLANLLLQKQDLPKDHRQLLDLIRISAQNSLELIADLLHVNTDREEFTRVPVDIQTVLLYCVEILQFKAESKKQRILLKTERMILMVNREKMWRVLSNLITNAIKFSPEHSDIVVELFLEGDKALITIRDQGIGIPEEMGEKVFDIFTKAKRRGTAGEESYGLGLSISKQIVEAHGGRIWYESGVGRGTVFFVELPVE